MWIYFGVLLFSLVCATITERVSINLRGKVAKKKIETIQFAFFLGTIMAFRGEKVGSDTQNYKVIYLRMLHASNIFDDNLFVQAPVYTIYSKILSLFFQNPQAIIIANSLIIIVCVSLYIYKNTTDVKCAWFVYITLGFYLFAFNASRQCVSMSIVLVMYTLIREHKIKSAIMLFLISLGIHQIAIIAAIYFFIMNIKWNLKKLIVITAFITGVEFLYLKVVYFFVKIFPAYNGYLKGKNLILNDGKTYAIYLAILLLSIIFWDILHFEFLSSYASKEEKQCAYQMICIILIYIVTAIVLRNMNFPARLSLYFSQLAIIYLPEFYIRQDRNSLANGKLIKTVMFFILLIPFYKNMQRYLPYTLFWK